MKKLVVTVLVLFAAVAAWWFSPTKPAISKGDDGRIPQRYVAKVETRDIEFTIEVNGDVTPDFQLDVRPEVGGKVKKIHVEPGVDVKKGDLLLEVDDTDLLTERKSALTDIEGAQLSVEKNRRNYERAKELFTAKLVSQEVFDNLSSDYELAQNSLSKAQRRLDLVDDKLRKTKIFANADGTVLDVKVIEGQVVIGAASVNSGTSLMIIADLSRLLVDTTVNQLDVAKLRVNQKVKLSTESIKDADMEATVFFIAPVASVKNNIKGFVVRALIDRPDSRLRPGMTVSMSIPIESAQQAVSVPVSAVFRGENNSRVVYVKNGQNTEPREVKVGVTNYEYAEIKSGVQPGEEILLVEPRVLQKAS